MILLFFFFLDRSDRRDLTAEPVKVAAFRRANRTKARESRGGRWESEWLAFVAVNAFMLVPVSAGPGDVPKKGGKVARHPRERAT